jgi:DNA-binding CsgD family transcriptional regulator
MLNLRDHWNDLNRGASEARCAVIRVEQDLHAYVHYLEERLQLSVFSRGAADPEAAVLLVRGALAADDLPRATELVAATEQLAAARPGNDDMAAAGAHARGLIEQDPAALERAAKQYSSPLGRAWAAEDAGAAWAQRGNSEAAVARLREAHALYRQLDAADSAARVRAQLLAAGIRVRHWRRADRPAFGWESLTETEHRVVHLVARGLSNRQIASQMYLSIHTIAFHLRRIYCKLDLTSRVQLATLATERARLGMDG